MKLQETGSLRSRFAKLKVEKVVIKNTTLLSSDNIDRAYCIDSGKGTRGTFGGYSATPDTERTIDNVDSLRYLLDAFTEIHSLIETD